jgi:hypothetical protein
MKRRNVHQWRDWLLDYIDDGKYELIQKDGLSIRTIVAKDGMDAENICRNIINKAKEKGGLDSL